MKITTIFELLNDKNNIKHAIYKLNGSEYTIKSVENKQLSYICQHTYSCENNKEEYNDCIKGIKSILISHGESKHMIPKGLHILAVQNHQIDKVILPYYETRYNDKNNTFIFTITFPFGD